MSTTPDEKAYAQALQAHKETGCPDYPFSIIHDTQPNSYGLECETCGWTITYLSLPLSKGDSA